MKNINHLITSSPEDYLHVLNNGFVGSLILDRNLTIKYVSPGLLKVSGYKADDLITSTPLNFLSQEDQLYVGKELQKLASHFGGVREIVVRSFRKDGKPVVQFIRMTNMLDAPTVEGIICHIYTLGQPFFALSDFVDSESFYRSFFFDNPLPIIICTRQELRVLEANKEASAWLGYERFELLSLYMHQLVAFNNVPLHDVINHPSGHGPTRSLVFETRHNGRRQCEVSSHPVTFREQPAMLITIHDVTDIRELQDQLLKARVEEQKAVARATLGAQEKQSMAIGMELHDNVNPVLASIKLLLEHGRRSGDDLPGFVDRCVTEIDKLIDDVRRMSQELAPPSLQAGLQEAIEELCTVITLTSKLEISYDFHLPDEESLSPCLKLNAFRMVQEQLHNVIKYAGASLLKISIQQQGKKLLVEISDNGKGFNAAAPRSGIGLRNILHRAEMFGGVATIQSAPGAGCRVHIELPVEEDL